MRATTIHAPGDIRISEVPDPVISTPTDAIVKVTAGCICGSDLWPYRGENDIDAGSTIGHECVGTDAAIQTAFDIARPGSTVGFVGVPHGVELPVRRMFQKNVGLAGGMAPVRTYLPDLLDRVLEGRIEPGLVFDMTLPLDEVAEGYRAMDERRAIKVLLQP